MFYTAFSRAQNMLVLSCQENTPKAKGQRNVPTQYFRPVYTPLKSWRDLTFDPSITKLAIIKAGNLKHSYSFTSDVLIFEACPQQYRFFKDLEFAPVRTNAILFGTLVHQTIEDIHKAVLRGDEQKVTTEQIDHWFRTNYANISQKERAYLGEPVLRIARRHVATYVDRERNNWHRLREAEVELSLLKDDYVLTGNVDLIQAEDGAWRQVVESVKVDFHYDGAVLTPAIVDAPGKEELVAGRYAIPADAATIRVKITDLLSESWEGDIENG